MTSSAWCWMSSLPSVAIAITCAPRARVLDVRDDLVVDVDLRRDDDDRRSLFEQRDRPVLHLARRVRLGRDVRDLLQLQRALERDRKADKAPEVEEERLL